MEYNSQAFIDEHISASIHIPDPKHQESLQLERKKQLARKKVWRARSRGKIKPQPCEECGTRKTEAHHDDYDQPLKVRWLCREHHETLHHKN